MIYYKFRTFKTKGKISHLLERWSGPSKYYLPYKNGYRVLRLNWSIKNPLNSKSLLLFGIFLGIEGLSSLDVFEIKYPLNFEELDTDNKRVSGQKIDLIKLLTKKHIKYSKL